MVFSVRRHLKNTEIILPYHRCKLGLALAGGKTLQNAEYLLLIVSKHKKKTIKRKSKTEKQIRDFQNSIQNNFGDYGKVHSRAPNGSFRWNVSSEGNVISSFLN